MNQFARLPGIGRKTALRLVLFLLKEKDHDVERFSNAFTRMKSNIKYCKECLNISEEELCGICRDTRRDRSLLCVVPDLRDVMAIENTHQYRGMYHILGGVINPIEGTGPQDLNILPLVERIEKAEVREVIMALPGTVEGETTTFFLFRRLKEYNLNFTTIARGIGVGDELEFADEVTLGRSIMQRIPYESSLAR